MLRLFLGKQDSGQISFKFEIIIKNEFKIYLNNYIDTIKKTQQNRTKTCSTEARTRGPQNKSLTRYLLDHQGSLNWEREKGTLNPFSTAIL